MDQETAATEVKPTEDEREKSLRITSSGKIKFWVSFSLTFFEDETKDKSLIIHTLPPSVGADTGLHHAAGKQLITRKQASTANEVIPRLISVVEIIKREYIKALEAKRSTRMQGLHQYNELGTLEQLGITITPTADGTEVTEEEARSLKIIEALGGRHHTRQTQSPYMRITLSMVERPDLIEKGATYQPSTVRRLSKTAKSRARKRQAKSKEGANDSLSMGMDVAA